MNLPGRWQGRHRFVILEVGFAAGRHFLATWQAWRDDPQRCTQLVVIAIDPHPPSREALARQAQESPFPELLAEMQRAWPPLTPDLHRLDFEAGRVQLLLAVGEPRRWLPELVASVDAFVLDGGTPASLCDERFCKVLGRLAAPGATLSAASSSSDWHRHLVSAGFSLQASPQHTTQARFAPAFTPRRSPARTGAGANVEPHALIVGGGLAGCAAAWALAEQGWRSTVLERHAQIAAEASGNPAGLFHGIVNAQDGLHAQFNRAAAFAAARSVRIALDRHAVAGAIDGLLRLETSLTHAQMQALLTSFGWPADCLQALDAEAASALGGIRLGDPAWLYPGGGWVNPAGLARSWLERAAAQAELRTDVEVHALRQTETGWRLLDAQGQTIAEAQTVVLANAGDAMRLLGGCGWPIDKLRGQLSRVPASVAMPPLPRVPIAGAGYLLPEINGEAIFGATAQRDDDDPAVRLDDHLANLRQLERLTGHRIDPASVTLQGRTAWRWSSVDRLPVIGAVPEGSWAQASPDAGTKRLARLDQPRFVPRVPGLYVFTALGSRGITWSALGAQTLASIITGAPAPLGSSLLDAIDPARFVSRQARRSPRA